MPHSTIYSASMEKNCNVNPPDLVTQLMLPGDTYVRHIVEPLPAEIHGAIQSKSYIIEP